MSERSDNPFKELGKCLFPNQDPRVHTPAVPRETPPARRTPERTVRELPDDDAALFLDAVGNIRRPQAAPGRTGHTPFAGAFGLTDAATPPKGSAGIKASPTRIASSPAEENENTATATCPEPSSGRGFGTSGEQDGKTPAQDGDDSLFFKAMQGVRPVAARGRDVHAAREPGETPPAADPRKLLQDILDGRVEFALHHTEEYMEGFVSGLDPMVVGRLRAGQFSPEGHIDLHGYNSLQAYDMLIGFIKNAWQRNMRTVIVVTGRGKNSPDGIGVLRGQLGDWLTKDPFKRVILAFCTAQPCDGGPGAVYVLLRKYKKSRGKILWERHSAMGME